MFPKSRIEKTVKFIPVKIDDVKVPSELKSILYIDIHSIGPEEGLRQIINVIENKSTYRSLTTDNKL